MLSIFFLKLKPPKKKNSNLKQLKRQKQINQLLHFPKKNLLTFNRQREYITLKTCKWLDKYFYN
jgi:hypothetical protein